MDESVDGRNERVSGNITEMELHELSARVGHLEGVAQEHGNMMRAISGKLDSINSSLNERTRFPMLPMVTMLIVAGGFIMTIMSLVTSFTNDRISGLRTEIVAVGEKLDEHDDGHPDWVTKIHSLHAENVGERLDAQRALLVAAYGTGEKNGNRITRLEAEKEQLVERFTAIMQAQDVLRAHEEEELEDIKDRLFNGKFGGN